VECIRGEVSPVCHRIHPLDAIAAVVHELFIAIGARTLPLVAGLQRARRGSLATRISTAPPVTPRAVSQSLIRSSRRRGSLDDRRIEYPSMPALL